MLPPSQLGTPLHFTFYGVVDASGNIDFASDPVPSSQLWLLSSMGLITSNVAAQAGVLLVGRLDAEQIVDAVSFGPVLTPDNYTPMIWMGEGERIRFTGASRTAGDVFTCNVFALLYGTKPGAIQAASV